jgi:NAD(P)-dependent dehydrogenase (short-subunit alcohol dehydrogenase family)
VLVNNAGYGSYGAVEDVPLDEARRQFDVNIFGLARLVQLVTPLMWQQRSGKILNVSSIGGKIVWESLGAWYQATKFAVEGFSDCLRIELKPLGIDVIVIEPGAIRTEWFQIALGKPAAGVRPHCLRPSGRAKTRTVPGRRQLRVESRRRSPRDHQGHPGHAPQDSLRCRRPCQAIGIHVDSLPRPLQRLAYGRHHQNLVETAAEEICHSDRLTPQGVLVNR